MQLPRKGMPLISSLKLDCLGVFSQILIATSLVIASYQDARERAVSDLVWIPSLAGVALVLLFTTQLTFTLVKIGIVGIFALAFTRYGAIGEADLIAFLIITADPAPFSVVFALGAAGIIIAAHIAYLYSIGYVGKTFQIPVEQFEREKKWIPKAIVSGGVRTPLGRNVNTAREEAVAKAGPGVMIEVTYGVPDVTYLGAGYLAFLTYLVIFNWGLFLTLP